MQLHKQIIKWPPNSFVKNIFGSPLFPLSLSLLLSISFSISHCPTLFTLAPFPWSAYSIFATLLPCGQPALELNATRLPAFPPLHPSLSLPTLWFIFCASVEWTETFLATCGKQKTGRKKGSKLGARGVYSILLFHLYPVKLVKRGSSDSRDTEMV